MTKQFTKKEVRLVSSLVKKGWSQGKIARKLHTRKLNITRLMQKRKIGKRAEGGAQAFWRDVTHEQELYGLTHRKARLRVKYSSKWFGKRQVRLTGIKKARDIIGEKTQRIKEGEIPDDWFTTEEGEEMMEYVGYD